MSDERHITDLQAAIRQAGRGTRAVRWGTAGCLSVPILLLGVLLVAIVYSGAHLAPPDPPEPTVANIARDVAEPAGVAALVGLVSVPAALVYRRIRRAGLRRRLAELPSEERAAVLLPLRSERLGDTRRIVTPLLREFGLPTELTPAAAPDARGDEASPADAD